MRHQTCVAIAIMNELTKTLCTMFGMGQGLAMETEILAKKQVILALHRHVDDWLHTQEIAKYIKEELGVPNELSGKRQWVKIAAEQAEKDGLIERETKPHYGWSLTPKGEELIDSDADSCEGCNETFWVEDLEKVWDEDNEKPYLAGMFCEACLEPEDDYW